MRDNSMNPTLSPWNSVLKYRPPKQRADKFAEQMAGPLPNYSL